MRRGVSLFERIRSEVPRELWFLPGPFELEGNEFAREAVDDHLHILGSALKGDGGLTHGR